MTFFRNAEIEQRVPGTADLCEPGRLRPHVGHQLLVGHAVERVDVEPPIVRPLIAGKHDVVHRRARREDEVAEAKRRAALRLEQERDLPSAEDAVDEPVPSATPVPRRGRTAVSTMPLVTKTWVRSNGADHAFELRVERIEDTRSRVMVFDQV